MFQHSFQSQVIDFSLQISIFIIWIFRLLINNWYKTQKQDIQPILALTYLCI